jgi:hypothetical protein
VEHDKHTAHVSLLSGRCFPVPKENFAGVCVTGDGAPYMPGLHVMHVVVGATSTLRPTRDAHRTRVRGSCT